ncbi:MAG TPA: RAP domain-containing protein, partial [Chlamydiales bacterium]|nr:RAP domain-containing protein [Chlamydiales bacterium]
IAVNGPCHYIRGTHTLKLEDRLLYVLTAKMLEKMRYRLIVLPFWEWAARTTEAEKESYLQQLTSFGLK